MILELQPKEEGLYLKNIFLAQINAAMYSIFMTYLTIPMSSSCFNTWCRKEH